MSIVEYDWYMASVLRAEHEGQGNRAGAVDPEASAADPERLAGENSDDARCLGRRFGRLVPDIVGPRLALAG